MKIQFLVYCGVMMLSSCVTVEIAATGNNNLVLIYYFGEI